jgi:hypothetical protein
VSELEHRFTAFAANFFLMCLKRAGYFGGDRNLISAAWTEDELFIGSVYRRLARVARWHISKPKILIWVNFGGTCNERFRNIFCPLGLFYCLWIYFVAIWNF